MLKCKCLCPEVFSDAGVLFLSHTLLLLCKNNINYNNVCIIINKIYGLNNKNKKTT